MKGAFSNVCNNMTGYCNCRQNVTGKSCDRCEQNAFNFTRTGCMPCNCNSDGSTDLQCDPFFGNCSCKEKVIGSKCDMCSAGFFDVAQGCLDCNCTSNQTVTNTTCDARGGQCQCITSPAGGRYGGRQCETCARYTVAIAENPLSCHACTEPCYRNWEGLIAIETDKVNKLSGNVTELLESFGTGLSVDGINQTLQLLNDNITYASQIFKSGGQADLKQKRDQINKIQESVESLQNRLNNSKSSIDDAMRYLQENVVNFNGSVHITPIMPVTYLSRPLVCPSQGGVAVIVNWECIEAMALIYRQRALQANASGHANYTSIQRSFIEIQQANATAHRAASMINASLSRLSEISELNNAVKIGDNFHSLNQNNSMKLKEIAEIIAMLEKLLLDVENYGNKTAMNLMKANETAILAKEEAGQRKREAESAFHNVSNAHDDIKDLYREAENVTNLARELKENASRVLNSTEEAIRNVTDGVNTLGRVHNMTVEAVKISNEVRAMSMPVSLQQIQNLTEDILNTNVNQSAVNKTLESAQAGLKQAKEVEELSQRAINVAEKTLSSVQGIESAVNSSEDIRREVLSVHQQTDEMITRINNITQTVNETFSASYISGKQVLAELNKTSKEMEEGLKCFAKAKSDAQNASATAQLAFNISENAKQMLEQSNASLLETEERVTFAEAAANLTEIRDTFHDSEALLKDVEEAKELLQQYTDQRNELERLAQELAELNKEADEMVVQFEAAAEKYGQCAGAT